MTTICISLAQQLENDFRLARGQLAGVRVRQALKDTPANRAAVAEVRLLIDAVLDMYLEATACESAGVQRLCAVSSLEPNHVENMQGALDEHL
jgi:hypothetical protein